MLKPLTAGRRKAALKPGVGGSKLGQWPNYWKAAHRKAKAKDANKKGSGTKKRRHSVRTKEKISQGVARHHARKGRRST